MANYAEQYPKCANCPRLQEWQVSRDAMTSSLEEAQINHKLQHIVQDDAFERKRAEIDEKYAELLDRAEAGDLPEDVVLDLKSRYSDLEAATVADELRKLRSEVFVSKTSDFMTRLADEEVSMQTEGCWGALEISLFGFHKVFCRSRVPRSLAIHPPLPPLK